MKLIIENLSKSFENKKVLENVSYEFDKGIVYALLGRNGSGKTTLFSLISSQLEKDCGKAYIESDGKKIELSPKNLFFMNSTPKLPNFLTGREFIKFFVEANEDKIDGNISIDQYFKMVNFDLEDSNKLIQGYSTGMKNKIQMMMFLIIKPLVILMDEPLTSLDVVVQLEMKRLIRQIHEDHIIIFSTHILTLAKDLCDEIVLLHDKKLERVDRKIINEPSFEDEIIRLLSDDNY
ncbi:MAG: ABC transporter ATP-binding protein [Tissierellia bacterium]|nr:ABC transporter ATP-binding protein [Tissierellia bacterium]